MWRAGSFKVPVRSVSANVSLSSNPVPLVCSPLLCISPQSANVFTKRNIAGLTDERASLNKDLCSIKTLLHDCKGYKGQRPCKVYIYTG